MRTRMRMMRRKRRTTKRRPTESALGDGGLI